MTEGPNASAARDEIDRLAQEFVERRRRGEQPLIEEYVAAHPQLADEIRALFPTLLFVEDFGSPSDDNVLVPMLEPDGAAPAEPHLQQVGEYRLLREIGRGGMGVVYEAEQASLGRRVALKVLPFHSLLDSKRLERFQLEARAAARLSHPNIVPVYGVGEHLGMHYYVMQLVSGQGLHRVIDEMRRLREGSAVEATSPPLSDSSSSSSLAAGLQASGPRGSQERYYRNAARLARDTALALDYAHGEGILHRDIKPSNLLLDPAGRVWLTDFGLAKAEDSDELTKSGDFVGTLLYMAPERFKGWSDPRSDVYSLGITLHELLTLRPAYSERDRAQLLRKVATEEPTAPRRVDRSIPRDLETIVLKAIAKEPTQRYDSARDMAQDLDRFLEGRPVEARRSRAIVRLGRWCARNPLAATMVAVALLLLLIVAITSSTAAVRLAGEQAAGREKLRLAYLAEASALRASSKLGRRYRALESLRQAAAIRSGPDLVAEAVATLAQQDMRLLRAWPRQKDETLSFSPDAATVVVTLPGGEIVLRAADDFRELYRLPGPGFHASYSTVELSRHGNHLAVRHEQGDRAEWHIWDLDRRVVCAIMTDALKDHSIDFFPDGRRVVLGTRDRALRLIDLISGNVVKELGRGWLPRGVAVHPGSRLLAISSDATRKVHVLDAESGHVTRTLGGSKEQAYTWVTWHPEGRTLVAGCWDHLIYLWNAESGELVRTMEGHWAESFRVRFNPGGTILSSTGWDHAVRFWETGTGRPYFALHHREGYFDFSGDRRCWSVVTDRAELWDVASTGTAFTIFGHDWVRDDGIACKHPHALSIAPGGQLAATAGDDGVRLWDLAARAELTHLAGQRVYSVRFDDAGTALYTSGRWGLHRWPVRAIGAAGTRLAVGPAQRLSSLQRWNRLAISNGGMRVAAVHQSDHMHVLERQRPERDLQLTGLTRDWTIALSADGAWAAAGTWGLRNHSEEVWVWDLHGLAGEDAPPRALQPVRKLRAPRAEVEFHPGNAHVATASPFAHTLWRLEDGEPIWRLEREPGDSVPGLIAFDRGGKLAALTHSHSRLWLIEALSGRKLAEVEPAETRQVNGLALEGGTLAACTLDRRFFVWDLNGLGAQIAELGMSWELPSSGPALAERRPLHAAQVDDSLDPLLDEAPEPGARRLFRPLQAYAYLPRLVSCAHIDQALEAPRVVIPEGGTWKYFRGRTEPSPGLEWTGVAVDDAAWAEGASPLSGAELSRGAEGTHLGDAPGSYTTLYLRHGFEVKDPAAIARWILAVEVQDGFVAYWNGEEIGRFNAGDRGARLSFQDQARSGDHLRLTRVLEVSPSLVRPGRNVLAIQALTFGTDSFVHVLPVLAGAPAPSLAHDRERTQRLLADPDGQPDASLLAYCDARILQRGGQVREALALFERASRLDPGASEPLLRRLACHRALGELSQAEALAREAIEGGKILEEQRLWRAWHRLVIADLGRSPADALATMPRDPHQRADGPASDHRWILQQLAGSGKLRIHCGGNALDGKDQASWSHDRFFIGGTPLDKGAPPPRENEAAALGGRRGAPSELGSTERAFPGADPFRPGYSIPLPRGRYRVGLHFVEWTHSVPGRRVFDVVLESRTVIERCNPTRSGSAPPLPRQVEVTVTDGALELDFIAHRDGPRIAGIEVERIDD